MVSFMMVPAPVRMVDRYNIATKRHYRRKKGKSRSGMEREVESRDVFGYFLFPSSLSLLPRSKDLKSSADIRKAFLEFFRERGHEIVPSAPVIPADDPTLLFTNAGMNQFKKCLTGEEKRSYVRAADTQKCLRVSGKHNDFEDVGYDGTHHTFFEMLGNWSFGDYYKKEAIGWAWEFLTKTCGIDKTRLYATVYKDDDEAEQVWKSVTDIRPDRVSRFDKENFWEMGDTGPCGPCSEIHIDRGEGFCAKDHACGVNVDGCGRFVELWNNVFIQYYRNEKGVLEPLKFKSVDTGMGLERLVSVLNGSKSNYETDLFTPLIARIEKDTGKNKAENPVAFQVIADHIRALTTAIADGGLPSNEGRGYVLRKILRRAVRFARGLGKDQPYLYTLVDTVCGLFGGSFPEMERNKEKVKSVLKTEEEKFLETLGTGLELIKTAAAEVRKNGGSALPGEVIFKLHDTYGFPADITKEICREEKLAPDLAGFERLMEEQRERGRSSWKKASGGPLAAAVGLDCAGSVFTGYDGVSSKGKILALIVNRNGTWEKTAEIREGDEAALVADRTPFYAESGGQTGDTGSIRTGTAAFEVEDTQKSGDFILHIGRVASGKISSGDSADLFVADARRFAIRQNHTSVHLLQSALRNILGPHVGQSGSAVNADRLRFDFTHTQSLSQNEIEEAERIVNGYIQTASPVRTEVLGIEEAKKKGALAFFGDKYGETVRVVSVEGITVEFCGGTHIDNIGRIGPFLIVSEGSVASGIRRIEAVTGPRALALMQETRKNLKDIADVLKTKTGLAERVAGLAENVRKLEKELKAKKSSPATADRSAQEKILERRGVKIALVEASAGEDLKALADAVKKKVGSGVVLCYAEGETDCSFVAAVTDDLTGRYQAGDIIKTLTAGLNGRGGGKPQFAQGAAPKCPDLSAALTAYIGSKFPG
jgi:alanyl-tRNA synthetase